MSSSIKSTALEPTKAELEKLSTGQKLWRLAPVYGLPIFTVVLVVFFSIILPDTFPTMLNVRSILNDKSIIAILSLAAMIPMMAGSYRSHRRLWHRVVACACYRASNQDGV